MKVSQLRLLVCMYLLCLPADHVHASPNVVVSKNAYDITTRSLKAHSKYVASLPGFRNGSTPLFYLHPPGSKVYGTVLIFHGYGQNAAASAIQAKFMHAMKFNVVAFNLAGFAQGPEFWVSTRLRKSAGYDGIRHALVNDSNIAPLISTFRRLGTYDKQISYHASLRDLVYPKIFASLKRNLAKKDYLVAERAFTLLQPGSTRIGMEKELKNYFISGHQEFESDPFQKLQLVQALPGPVYAIGYSFGAAAVVNLAARSRIISKAVLLSPSFGRFTDRKREDLSYFRAIFSALDLFDVAFPEPVPMKIPGRSVLSPAVSVNLLNRDIVITSMRESTRTLCIIAEDDPEIDVSFTLEVCRGKLEGKTFKYPKLLKLGHFITPETGSKYGNALLEQIANFFSTGNIDGSKLLIPNK